MTTTTYQSLPLSKYAQIIKQKLIAEKNDNRIILEQIITKIKSHSKA